MLDLHNLQHYAAFSKEILNLGMKTRTNVIGCLGIKSSRYSAEPVSLLLSFKLDKPCGDEIKPPAVRQ